MLKLKLQYFGHLMQRANSLEKSLMMAKTEGSQRMKWLDGLTDVINVNFSKFREMGRRREAWCAAVPGIAELDTTGQLNNNKQNTRIK